MAYLIIYQTQKCRKMVYTFVIDQSQLNSTSIEKCQEDTLFLSACSFVLHHKKAFNFKHNSVVERVLSR